MCELDMFTPICPELTDKTRANNVPDPWHGRERKYLDTGQFLWRYTTIHLLWKSSDKKNSVVFIEEPLEVGWSASDPEEWGVVRKLEEEAECKKEISPTLEQEALTALKQAKSIRRNGKQNKVKKYTCFCENSLNFRRAPFWNMP